MPSKDERSANSVSSITRQDLGKVAELNAEASNEVPKLAPKEENSVLQKLQKWADYDSYGEPVQPTRFYLLSITAIYIALHGSLLKAQEFSSVTQESFQQAFIHAGSYP